MIHLLKFCKLLWFNAKPNSWQRPVTRFHEDYDGQRVTVMTCSRTSEVRLCHPTDLWMYSRSQDREARANLADYLKLQYAADEEQARYENKWRTINRQQLARRAVRLKRKAEEEVHADLALMASACV